MAGSLRRRSMLVAAGFGVVASGTQVQAGRTIDEYVSGYWTVYAWEGDNGRFSHCGIDTNMTDGTRFGLSLDVSSGLVLMVNNFEWAIPDGRTYTLTVAIDRMYVDSFVAYSFNDGVMVEIGWDERFWQAFRLGSAMSILPAHGRGWDVSLRGTMRAAEALSRCYTLYGSDSNPFE